MAYSIKEFQECFKLLQKDVEFQQKSLISEADIELFDDTTGNLIDEVFVLDRLKGASKDNDSLVAMVETLQEQNHGHVIDRLLGYTREEPELAAQGGHGVQEGPDEVTAPPAAPSLPNTVATAAWAKILQVLDQPEILPTLPAASLPKRCKRQNTTVRSTIEVRRAIIDFYRVHGGSQMAVARFLDLHRPELKITASKISKWLKDEASFNKEAALRVADKDAKRVGAIRHPRTKRAMRIWVTNALDKGLRITGDILREKWQEFATNLGNGAAIKIGCTNGWLDSFKRRVGLRSHTFIGKAGSTDDHAVAKERLMMQALLREYSLDDIYNVDETGVFYGNIPRHGLDTQSRAGVKQNKVRFTLAVVCNASGTDKRQLIFIGTAAKPRCFNNLSPNDVGYWYRNNKTAWMTAAIYNEWLAKFDLAMRRSKRKVVLLHNNFSGHKITANLVNITIFPFTANLTSRVQPLDQGIIAAIKAHYCAAVVKRALRQYDSGVDDPKGVWQLDVRQGMEMIEAAWDKVSQRSTD